MALKDKLKELRMARGLTQGAVAEHLFISAQTVSKWERGLLSPDIQLLPKIAMLYQCSIDSLFEMGSVWGEEHRRKFEAEIRELRDQKKYDDVYVAVVAEIERNPEHYEYYPMVMDFVLRQRMFSAERVRKMLAFAHNAELCCNNDDIRNEIYRLMLQICSQAEDAEIREKAMFYYNKLPLLKHSREVYASCVMKKEDFPAQARKTLIYAVDIAECALRKLVTPEMTQKERIYYHKKAAALYETVLDGEYGGIYDGALLANYLYLIVLLGEMGNNEERDRYMASVFQICRRHLSKDEQKTSPLLGEYTLPDFPNPQVVVFRWVEWMLKNEKFAPFQEELERLKQDFLNAMQ